MPFAPPIGFFPTFFWWGILWVKLTIFHSFLLVYQSVIDEKKSQKMYENVTFNHLQ